MDTDKRIHLYVLIFIVIVTLFTIAILLLPPPMGGASYLPDYDSTLICPESTPDTEQELSIDYLQQCYGCVYALTPTGTPSDIETEATNMYMDMTSTAGANPEHTPEPEITPTIELTPTPVVTDEYYLGEPIEFHGYAESNTNNGIFEANSFIPVEEGTHSEYVGVVFGYKNGTGPSGTFPDKVYIDMNWLNSDSSVLENMSQNGFGPAYKYKLVYNSGHDINLINDLLYLEEMITPNYTEGYSSWNWNDGDNIGYSGYFQVTSYYDVRDASMDFELIPIYYGVEPTGEITPTPEIIDCEVYDYEEKEPLVDMGELMWTEGECITILPGQEITIPGDPPTESGWPEVQICPIYVDVPELTVMEIEIPLTMAALPFVIWLIKLIIRL